MRVTLRKPVPGVNRNYSSYAENIVSANKALTCCANSGAKKGRTRRRGQSDREEVPDLRNKDHADRTI